jgi:hypothetical protein
MILLRIYSVLRILWFTKTIALKAKVPWLMQQGGAAHEAQ